MKTCIVGVGAVGMVIADRMTGVLGKDNTIILGDSKRIDRYRSEGLFYNGRKEDFNYQEFEDCPECELLIIATKNLQLNEVLSALSGRIKKGTLIMSLLNGIESEGILEEAFPQAHVLYSFAKGMSSEHVGNQVFCTNIGKVYVGERDSSVSEAIIQVRELFLNCGLGIETPSDILHELYSKFALNVAYNTISAICFAGYGDFSVSSSLITLIDRVFAEVQDVSLAYAGVKLTQEDWQRTKNTIAGLDYEGKTSMYQDLEAGRKSENQWFTGTVSKLGKKFGIPTPYCDVLNLTAESCEFVRMRREKIQ